MKRVFIHVLLPAVVAAVLPGALFAQNDRGTVTGVVMDSSGSVVPGAQVVAINQGTGIETSTITGASGTYTIPDLPIGTYTVTSRLAGFKSYSRPGIPIEVSQTTRIDITLEVGSPQEKVTVSGEAPVLNVESGNLSMVMNSTTFLDLPLTLSGGFRRASSFIFLAPGVSGTTWDKHINGGGQYNDGVYFDGAALNASPNNDGQYSPSVDAIGEFNLITNNYSAEYGHAMAGVTSFTMKSGTNRFHGDLFEFFRNDKLDARGFFSPTRAPTRQNEFGGTFGGPIIKDKTFFFFSIDDFRLRQGAIPPLVTVPSPQFLQGNFSQWPEPIYDPATTTPDGKGGFTRSAFAGNIIPSNRFSPISSKIAALLPPPLIPGQLVNNYLALLTTPQIDANNWNLKVDHQLTSSHKVFGTFMLRDGPAIKGGAPGVAGPAQDHNRQDLNSRFFRGGEDWIISPTLFNHVIASFDRVVDTNRSLSAGQGWPQKLGLTGVQGDLFPSVAFNQGFVRLGDADDYRETETTFGVIDTLSATKGKHSLKIGFEYERHRDNELLRNNSAGTYHFSNLETAFPGDSSTGNAIASFLLGDVDTATAHFMGAELGIRWNYFATFLQDDYKVTPKLTLNLGLRWEVQMPFADPLNRLSYMDPSVPNPGAGNLPGAYVFAGPNSFNRIANPDYRNFGPRFGFAYNFADKWVIRGGYGLFYWGTMDRTSLSIPADGFNLDPTFTSGNVGITPAFNWDNGFPQNFQHPPIMSPTVDNGLNPFLNLRSRGGVWPYAQQWNIALERQLGASMIVRASYVGTKGSRLQTQYDATGWNQVSPQYLAVGNLLNSDINSPEALAAGFHEPFAGFSALWGGQATIAQALRPFPQYGNVGQFNATYGDSNYHSLQLYAQKHMTRGLDFTAAYTFSKTIDDTSQFGDVGASFQDFYNRRLDRSVSAENLPQILSFSYRYELPFGQGKPLLGNLGGLPGKLVSGWIISGFHTYESGLPISLVTTNTLPLFNPGLRPNVVLGVPQRAPVGPNGFDPAQDLWLNPAAFVQPPDFTFGTVARFLGNLRKPATYSESMALLKDTRLSEQFNLQFRLEISNPFNRVIFGGPATDISSPDFGTISSQANNPRNVQLGLKLMW